MKHTVAVATLLMMPCMDVATIPVPETNGKNPVRGMSLMPHMLSAGKETIPERTMIFELWGNIGLRKGDYKLWSQIGRDYSPDWDAVMAELERTDLELFDLSKDVAEKNDLRMKLPEVYASLRKELIDHLSNINSEYPGGGSSETRNSKKPIRLQQLVFDHVGIPYFPEHYFLDHGHLPFFFNVRHGIRLGTTTADQL